MTKKEVKAPRRQPVTVEIKDVSWLKARHTIAMKGKMFTVHAVTKSRGKTAAIECAKGIAFKLNLKISRIFYEGKSG